MQVSSSELNISKIVGPPNVVYLPSWFIGAVYYHSFSSFINWDEIVTAALDQ